MRLAAEMLSVAEAEKLVRDNVALLPMQDCPLGHAQGRTLRQSLVADRDLPPFDRVTMDGYAIRHAAWGGGIRRFRVAGIQAAGTIPLQLSKNDEGIEVMTGAMLPEGADTVVPYEDAERDGDAVTISRTVAVTAGQAVHRRGSDRTVGEVIVPPGTRLTGREIAVAAACGYAQVSVTMQPAIAVVATGDELVEVDSPVAPHQIRRSNDHALRAALIAAGYPRVERFHLRDMRHEIEHRLWHLIAEYDLLVLIGGISKGKFDPLPSVLAGLGVVRIFQGVAQRPGKPLWFGLSARRTPIFALPGNPVSSYTCLHRYVLPALAKMSGCPAAPAVPATLTAGVEFKPRLTWFLPVRIFHGARGERLAAPDPSNTSGDFAGLVGADGFVELPAEPEQFPAGTMAPFWPWV